MDNQQAKNGIEEIGRKYAEVLRQKMNLRALYVFGSHAKGGYDSDSDIDIAVVSDDFTGDIIDDTFILLKLRRGVDMRIEPHPFSPSDFAEENPMAREIIQTGIRVV